MSTVSVLRHPEPARTDDPAKSKFSWDWGLYLVSSSATDDRPNGVL